jgi:hypothetical protein
MAINFREWLLNEFDHDTWASVPQHDGTNVVMMDPKELYEKQSPANKRIMQMQAKEDVKYLANLQNSVNKGMKQPIRVHPNMSIHDGLHRLAVALALNLTQVPVIITER